MGNMAVIKVNTDGITGLCSNVRTIRSKNSDCYAALNQVKNNLDWQVQAKSNINGRIKSLQQKIKTQDSKLEAYMRALGSVSGNFNQKDQQLKKDAKNIIYTLNLCAYASANIGNNQKTNSSKNSWLLDKMKSIGDLFGKDGDGINKVLLGVIKKAGYLGGLIGFGNNVIDIISGGGPGKIIKTAYSTIKDIIDLDKTVEKLGKVKRILHPDKVKTSWMKKIFGLGDYFSGKVGTASKAKSFGTRFYNNLQKAKIKEIAKVSWLDVAISGVVNIFENKKEYDTGSISAGRAVAETVSETMVDVGVNAALTVTAAAAIGAAFGAAPVIAVGGAVVVAKLGLDAVAKWATGGEKDFTEAASDLILDTGTAIAKGIASGAKKVGDCISSAWDAVKPKWKFSFGF